LESEYITPTEAAARLGVTRQAIYQWIREGRLEAKRFGSLRGMRIPRVALDEFVRASSVRPKEAKEAKPTEEAEGNQMPTLIAA
jgi:excisionase family DNA binding protein